MKVILIKEVQKIGHIGDIIEAKEGYARNFLIPQGLAEIPTKHRIRMLKEQKVKREKNDKKDISGKKLLANRINNQKLTITAKTDEKGTLYAGLDKSVIACELAKQKINISPSEILLKKNIKTTGQHSIDLRLGGKKVNIKLEIVSGE